MCRYWVKLCLLVQSTCHPTPSWYLLACHPVLLVWSVLCILAWSVEKEVNQCCICSTAETIKDLVSAFTHQMSWKIENCLKIDGYDDLQCALQQDVDCLYWKTWLVQRQHLQAQKERLWNVKHSECSLLTRKSWRSSPVWATYPAKP